MPSQIPTRPVEPKPAKQEPKPRKGMRPISRKRAEKRASPEGQAGLAYMAKVRAQPCIICREFGMVQTDKTEAHHWIVGRYGNEKTSDFETIPLCRSHHKDGLDKSKVKIHRNQEEWVRLYGPDYEYSARVRDIIEGKAEI